MSVGLSWWLSRNCGRFEILPADDLPPPKVRANAGNFELGNDMCFSLCRLHIAN